MSKINQSIIFYIILTFTISAFIWSMSIFVQSSVQSALIMFGTFVPSSLALFITFRRDKKQFKALLKSLFTLKAPLKTFVMVFIYLPSIVLISYMVMHLLNIETPSLSYKIYEIPIVFIVILFAMGPLGEELGWRGYLLPKLNTNFHIIKANMILGIIWGLWHLPLFFILGSLQNQFVLTHGFFLAMFGYMIYTILLSVFMGIMYEKTNGSVCAQVLIHTTANLSIGMMPIVFHRTGALIQLVVMSLFTIILVYVYKRNNGRSISSNK